MERFLKQAFGDFTFAFGGFPFNFQKKNSHSFFTFTIHIFGKFILDFRLA